MRVLWEIPFRTHEEANSCLINSDKSFRSTSGVDCCPSRRSDKAWGVDIEALLVSPSNRCVHLCCPAEHEPATARLKIPFPQSWVSYVSPRRNRTSKDARKRKRETGAAASFQRTFDSPKKPLPFCCTREALESKHDLVICHKQHQQQKQRGDRERRRRIGKAD